MGWGGEGDVLKVRIGEAYRKLPDTRGLTRFSIESHLKSMLWRDRRQGVETKYGPGRNATSKRRNRRTDGLSGRERKIGNAVDILRARFGRAVKVDVRELNEFRSSIYSFTGRPKEAVSVTKTIADNQIKDPRVRRVVSDQANGSTVRVGNTTFTKLANNQVMRTYPGHALTRIRGTHGPGTQRDLEASLLQIPLGACDEMGVCRPGVFGITRVDAFRRRADQVRGG